jgi:hypothetical protein
MPPPPPALVGLAVLVGLAGPARADGRELDVGVMLVQAASYFGKFPGGSSEGKLDSNGIVTNVVGLHARYRHRVVRYLEVGPRLDVMYIWFERGAYLPDSLTDVRATLAIAGVVPIGRTAITAGIDAGVVASGLHNEGDHELAAGKTAAVFVGVRSSTWAPWGWFVDLSGGAADVTSADYSTEMIWLARLSLGAAYTW